MKIHFNFTLLLPIYLLLASSVNAEFVSVGEGGYITHLPTGQKSASDQNKNPVTPKVVTDFTQPPQTNDWWSSLIWQYDPTNSFSDNLFAHPLACKAVATGLEIGYPNKYSISPETVQPKGHKTQEYHYGNVKDLLVGVSGLTSPDTRVSKYSQWCVTAVWQANEKKLEATIGHGLPFVYFIKTGGDVIIKFSGTPEIWSTNDGVLGVTINGRHYGIFFPAGSTYTGTNTIQSALNGKDYFSIAVLPNNTAETLEFYRKHAYAFVTNSMVTWNYNESNAEIISQFSVDTTLKESGNGNVDRALLALYRHQWLYLLDDTTTEYSYVSPRGQMKVIDSSTFTTHYTFHGVLPILPDVAQEGLDGYSKTQLCKYVDEIFKQSPSSRWKSSDTYWSGKEMGRVAILLQIADQVEHTDALELFLKELKSKLQDWLNGKSPNLYYYDSTWKALIGYPASFGSDTEFNDHHFHWSYAIMAAAIVAKYDPSWASQSKWGGMIELLIKDVANWDKFDERFPFLRSYDVYAGHSWANGPAAFAAGNNQESSSESINFSTACILFGSVTGNKTIRDLGIFLYATEVAALQQYWFDVDNTVFPDGFKSPTLGIVWGDGGAYAIWWDGYVEELHGINFLPITGGSLHLGLIPDYLKLNQQFMLSNSGGNNSWKDIQMEVKALYDPKAAIADFNAGYTPEAGESIPHTYHWIHTLNTLGKIDPTITANIPTYAVFKKDTKRTYVAYNASDTSREVIFSNGAKMTVPAHAIGTSKGTISPTPTYSSNAAQISAGTVRIEFSSNQIVDLQLKYHINSGSTNSVAMQKTAEGKWYFDVKNLNDQDIIRYQFSFQFNGSTHTTTEQQFTYKSSPTPTPSYDISVEQKVGSLVISFKPTNFTITKATLHYKINNGAAQSSAMNNDNGVLKGTISGLKSNDSITYSVSFSFENTTRTTQGYNYIYKDNEPNPSFTHTIDSVKRIVFKRAENSKFVYILYTMKGIPKTIRAMNKDADSWYYLIPDAPTEDQITYSFGYESKGKIIYTDEFTAKI